MSRNIFAGGLRPSLLACAVAVAMLAGIWTWRALAGGDRQGLLRSDGVVDATLDCDPCSGDLRWTGTWFFPRGGPYLFFVEVLDDSHASLSIDGKEVLTAEPRRQVRDPKSRMSVVRQVAAAGPHEVAIEHMGRGRMRVYWLPPGRRGDPEYIPPAALRPVAPAEAGPMPRDLNFRGEAAAFSASLLVLAALATFFWRRGLAGWRPVRADIACALAVFAAAAALRLWNVHAFGQTWDEDVYWSSGRNYLVNLANLDFRWRMWTWNFEHPPVAKYVLGLGALWHDGYGPARVLVALLSAGTCLVVFLMGRELFSRRVGMAAGLLAAFAPHLIAHGAIAGLETPSTFFVTLAMYSFLRRSFVLAGVAGGLATGSRFIAVLVFFAMAASTLLELLASLRARGDERRFLSIREWLHLALAPVAGALTLFLVWPRMWLEGPGKALWTAYHRLNVQHTPEWFLGHTILDAVPKGYFFVYFVAGMTPPLLLGLACAPIFRRERAALRLLPFLLSPFGVMYSPVIQSGLRYLLPVVPPACVLAAAGLDAAAGRLARFTRGLAPRVVLGAAVLSCLWSSLAVRPYYLDYYNALFGGAHAAWARRRFVFGWWGEGIAAAVEHVNRVARRGARVHYDLFPNHIVWLRDDLQVVRSPAEADWVLYNRFQFRPDEAPPGFAEVFAEKVGGAPLVKLYARR